MVNTAGRKASNLMTNRQAQVAALAAVGASVKETADVLGVAPQTIRSYRKQLRVIQKLYNIDYWGMPIDREGRRKEFLRVINNLKRQYKFSEEIEETNERAD